MDVQKDGKGLNLPINQQSIEGLNIEGFVSIIINVTSINNLQLFPGIANPQKEKPVEVSYHSSS